MSGIFGNVKLLGWFADQNSGGTITGSGTANTIAMFTSATAIGNSVITQDAGATKVRTQAYTFFNSSSLPSGGEPNEFAMTITAGPVLVGNNYNLRSSFYWASTQNNSSWRIGAQLGTFQVTATDTGTLGWGVGNYGSFYNRGAGNVVRGIAGYFVAINESIGGAGVDNLYAGYFQNETTSGATTNSTTIFVRTPVIGGTVVNNTGILIDPQAGIGSSTNYSINSTGASDLANFAGNLTVGGTITGTTSIVGTTSVTTPLIIGGSAISSKVTIKSTTGAGTATGIAFEVIGGTNGATDIFRVLNNRNMQLPNNMSILGLNSSGGGYTTLLNWSAGDNVTMGARSGVGDFTIDPTSTAKGVTIRSYGGVGIFGVPTPLGHLHIGAGVAAALGAPLVFTSGVNLTTPINGAMEYNGTNLFFTRSATTRQTVLTANVVTTEVVVSDTTVTINIAGTDYKLLARA